jgi:Uma2 family endonuclease
MIAAAQAPVKIYTVEEYFELEKTSKIKHEFVYGKLIPMPGEAREANEIATNIVVLMKPQLRKKGFKIYDHDVRTIVKDNGVYRYPDVVVTHITDDSDRYHVKQPILLVEVTSEDSAKTDRETKLAEYSKIESVQYYLIIDQNEMRVEMYERNGNRWFYDQFSKPTDIVELPIFEQILLLADIYEDVVFKVEPKTES